MLPALYRIDEASNSGFSAAALLVARGMTGDEAFARISERRRVTVPDTDEQRRWIDTYSDALQS